MMTPPARHVVTAPAAAPAHSSHHAPHPVRRCVLSTCLTLSDSFARRTRGSDSPLESVSLPSHPVAALTRAAGPHQDSLPEGRTGTCIGGEGASRNTATFAVSRERRAGPALAIAGQEDTVQISCRRGRVMATRRGYRASATTCRAVCPGGPTVKNSAQKRYFANRTVHSLYFHPAHGGDL